MNFDDLVKRDGLYYQKFADVPFTGDIVGRQIGKMKKGKRDGKWVMYWKDGQLRYKINWKDGKLDGESIQWYFGQKGQKWKEQNYKDGNLVSETKYETQYSYYENGQIRSQTNYKDGQEVDETKYAYYANGQIEYKFKVNKDGKLDGKVTEWFENGEIEQEATFKDGKCISGDCNLFVCVETEAQERDGIIYLPNETKPFTGNNMCVYANGQFKSQGKVKDGKKNGKQINWYESGQTMYEHYY